MHLSVPEGLVQSSEGLALALGAEGPWVTKASLSSSSGTLFFLRTNTETVHDLPLLGSPALTFTESGILASSFR